MKDGFYFEHKRKVEETEFNKKLMKAIKENAEEITNIVITEMKRRG